MALVAVGAVSAALAAPAAADHNGFDFPWPRFIPPRTDVPRTAPPTSVPNCPRPEISCVDALLAKLEAQWRRFDATCDHRAVIAYSYYVITRELRRDLARAGPGLIRDREYFITLIIAFSNRYLAAFEDWEAGRAVPEGWRILFEAARSGDANAGQDTLLFSNVHVQHDLPLVLEQLGVRAPDGQSRKPDHDAVNRINTEIFDEVEDLIARRYDPTFSLIDLKPLPLEEIGTLELVKYWRQGAWRAAERLLAARSEAERRLVIANIQDRTRGWARLIAGGGFPGTRARRDAHCARARALQPNP